MRKLILLGSLLALFAGSAGSAGSAATSPTLQIGHDPFRVSVLERGKVVVAEQAAARLRFELREKGEEYSLTDVVSQRGNTYTVATTDPGRTASVTVEPDATGATISVSIRPARGVLAVYDAFATAHGEHFLGGGEQGGGVDLAGRIVSLVVSEDCSYAPIPYFASSAGWGLRLATENAAAFAFPGSPGGAACHPSSTIGCQFPPLEGRAEVCVEGAALDEKIYLGSIPRILADYEADTGRPLVPPASELELIKWRDVYTGSAQVLQDITRLQAAGVPLGWVELDNPWEPCVGELTFDPHRIPDPARLIAEVHAHGVRFMIWISPKIICGQGYPAGSLLGPASNSVLDLRKAQVLKIYQARLRRLFALGVNGVKADRGDEVDLSGVSPTLTNDYPLLYARAVLAVMPHGDAAIFRAATVGSQSLLPGMWGGDQEELWSGLQMAIVEAQTAGVSGFPTWGSDVGGYDAAGQSPTAELFERWAEFGAISPVMEVGGQGANATPWVLGTGAMDALRAAAVLHYELFPYFYGLLARHRPVLEPLAYSYPDDAHAWASPYELLVGPDLLAAPVTGPGDTPSVYLPPGAWVDLYAGSPVRGGGPTFTRDTPDDEFPLYVRAGTVMPFNLRTATGSWWGVDQLSSPGRRGFLATNGALLDLRRLPRQVQIFVPAPARPAVVTLGGRRVPFIWQERPLPGVVVRVAGPTVQGRIVAAGS